MLGHFIYINVLSMNIGTFFKNYGATDVKFPCAVSVHMPEKSMDMFKGKPAWGFIKTWCTNAM